MFGDGSTHAGVSAISWRVGARPDFLIGTTVRSQPKLCVAFVQRAISSIMSIESAVTRSAWCMDQATTMRIRRLWRGVTRMSLPQAVSTLGTRSPQAVAHRPYEVT